jgi:hypothetical protein
VRIVVAEPPMIEEIDAAFHVRGKPILFAFGDRIYNPGGVYVPPELMAHEFVHGERQGHQVGEWWRRYIADPAFRLEEEIPAHIAEYRAICARERSKWVSERNMRRTAAAHVARKLSAPLYGRLITFEAAKKLLQAA